MAKVTIIGQGYVGLTIASFAANHHTVSGFDNRADIVENLNAGKSHIEGVASSLLAKHIQNKSYVATTDPSSLSGAEIVVIAVPTPLDQDRKPDLSYLESACKVIGENLTTPALIINESTSFPGTVRDYIKPTVEKFSKNKIEHLYSVSPERVDPGREDWNQKNTPRLYAGLTRLASEKTRDFYSTFCDQLVEVSSPEVAEAAKLFENTFRQVNIALVNEFAVISNSLGISVNETLQAANTKPYGFMKFTPSAGVGGHCIPVDPSYLSYAANQKGISASFIDLANQVNLDMPKYVVKRVEADNGGSLKGKTVQVIGVAYKPNVADVRETPAQLVIEELKSRGATVSWHDPIVAKWSGESSQPLGGSQIAVLVTRHSIFQAAELLASAPYIFDTTGTLEGAIKL
jgi:UDP-N-acetyl-D-glucosamine dehydrogenase